MPLFAEPENSKFQILNSRFKRILVLGVAVLAVVLINKYFVNTGQNQPSLGFAIQPLSKGFSLAEAGVQYDFYKDKLKSYPEPSKFKSFEYKDNDLEFNGECSDVYYTILIYSNGLDYRANPASAKFNQAFECLKNKKFSFKLDATTGLIAGKYYIIIADQGKDGSWYNPR